MSNFLTFVLYGQRLSCVIAFAAADYFEKPIHCAEQLTK
jgi:hypothetical protein